MTIQELLDNLKIEYLESGHHHSRPGWIQLKDCPFCSSDNYHLGFNVELKFFACWRCGGHHIIKTLLAFGVGYEKARKVVAGLDTPELNKPEISRVSLQIPKGIGRLLDAHVRYLESRGFDPKEIERVWHVKGIGIASRLAWRIYIPIIYQGEVVSWTTRSIGREVSQRYISASAEEERINHKSLLYGQDYCYHSIIVVEGPTDVWNVGPGAVALFGTAFTSAQVKRLIQFPYRYIVFDSSDTAQTKADELANQLSTFPGTTQTVVLDADDPGSATRKEIKRLRAVARL